MSVRVDVVVWGGGLAGVAAAAAVRRAGRSVLLLCEEEALGHDCHTATQWTATHGPVDVGLTYWSPAQNYVFQELLEHDLGLLETQLPHDKGWRFELRDGTLHESPGSREVYPGEELADELVDELDDLCLMVALDPRGPHRCLDAEALDRHTVASWLETWLAERTDAGLGQRDQVRQALAAGLRAVFGAELDEIGMLYLLHYGASAGTFGWLVAPIGAHNVRFAEGSATLVSRLAEGVGLGAANEDDVWRGVRGVRLEHGEAGVTVHMEGHPTVHAQRAVVAGSPQCWPNLPVQFREADHASAWAHRQALGRAVSYGRTIRAFVYFERPVWLENGLQGTLLATREPAEGPIAWTLDHSLPAELSDAPPRRYGIMCGISGRYADHWRARSRDDRRAAVIDQLARLLGPGVRDAVVEGPDGYLESLDARPGDVTYTAPLVGAGVLTRAGAHFDLLGDEVGRVGFASNVLAEQWAGTMEGALHAGDRAGARAVVALDEPATETVAERPPWSEREGVGPHRPCIEGPRRSRHPGRRRRRRSTSS